MDHHEPPPPWDISDKVFLAQDQENLWPYGVSGQLWKSLEVHRVPLQPLHCGGDKSQESGTGSISRDKAQSCGSRPRPGYHDVKQHHNKANVVSTELCQFTAILVIQVCKVPSRHSPCHKNKLPPHATSPGKQNGHKSCPSPHHNRLCSCTNSIFSCSFHIHVELRFGGFLWGRAVLGLTKTLRSKTLE